MNKHFLWSCLVLACCGPVDTEETGGGTDVTTSTATRSTSTAEVCPALQPCADAAGEASQLAACQQQHPETVRALGCALDAPAPDGCTDLATLAPFACVDGTSVRVVCCL